MVSAPLQQKSIIEPTLTEVLVNFKRDIFLTMNCIKVGTINSFDANKKTAEVQILFKKVLPDGTIVSYKPLVDVPVFTLQGGGGALQFPIQAGDQCIVLFSDRRLDEWLQNGAEAAPGDGRAHDLSDGIALVGINAVNSSLPAAPTNKVVLSYMGTSFQLTAGGWNIVGAGTAEVDLQGAIVTIKNATTTLLTLMQNFITLLEGATVQDPISGPIPLTAATIALLEAFKAQFATLLG